VSDGPDFGNIRFGGKLRPSQVAAVSVIKPQLNEGEKRLHIVAPPGSGKTVLGLYVWADLVRKPALVLSPNSAIQAQWAARTDLFELDGKDDQISIDPERPGLLTSLTYQSVTMPKRGGEGLDESAMMLWAEKLVEKGEAVDITSAEAWIADLEQKNPTYYAKRVKVYRKAVRDDYAKNGNALWTLHESSRSTLLRLKEAGIGLIILDECHHLLHHWGRVLHQLKDFFDDPVVLGLTATPPDAEKADDEDALRYAEFLGDIDYEVPVPALVRDANLAPYQDLCYFVRPARIEMDFIRDVNETFDGILQQLNEPSKGEGAILPLTDWVEEELSARKGPSGGNLSWDEYTRAIPDFSYQGRIYLALENRPMPAGVPADVQETDAGALAFTRDHRNEMLRSVVSRYVRLGLRRSSNTNDQEKAERAAKQYRLLGTQITETGSQPCASPINRILAYSNSKCEALSTILQEEMQNLGNTIRAVVITDFEKTSSTLLIDDVLDDEAGGAVAAFRHLVACPAGDMLDPILMTGSTVLVDDDLSEAFLEKARAWIAERHLKIVLRDEVMGRYHEISGSGEDWVPRYYSTMITEFFQEGFTRCLIGTRGLMGEGWDASRINVLIDLTSVTTNMSINQLRGRSIRLDKHWPEKVANNWDVICLADEFQTGFSDYKRFIRKHKQLYGVGDDGAIEKGPGHVHPAFMDAEPMGIHEGMAMFNDEMLKRSKMRTRTRELWGIGQPFNAEPKDAVESKQNVAGPGFGFSEPGIPWSDASLTAAMSEAIVGALIQTKQLPPAAVAAGGDRGGGWIRMHLANCSPEEATLFSKCLEEVLSPLEKPRYVISRAAVFPHDTWLTRLLPEVLAKYLRPHRHHLVMFHNVPSALANTKRNAALFKQHWDAKFGESELFYVHSKEGRFRLEQVQASGMTPQANVQRKSLYL
tara:strand:+ start:160 stop:2949 length:2790 start_codon:yes stop_codon:yes gene_type:complete